jgi:hypothetical protein
MLTMFKNPEPTVYVSTEPFYPCETEQFRIVALLMLENLSWGETAEHT